MLIEVYNEDGLIILDNETKVLKATSTTLCTGTIKFDDANANTGDWVSDWSTTARIPGTTQTIEMVVNPYKRGNSVPPDYIAWKRALDGSSFLMSQVLTGVGANSNWNVMGSGVETVYTHLVVPADASGYIDCYNEAGELTWSLSSLLKVPQILDVIDAGTTNTISLLDYPASMRERIFFSTPTVGIFEIADESSATYYAVHVYRTGNTIKFGHIYNSGNISEMIMVAYIPSF